MIEFQDIADIISNNEKSTILMTLHNVHKTLTSCPTCGKKNINFVKRSNERRKCDYCPKYYNIII